MAYNMFVTIMRWNIPSSVGGGAVGTESAETSKVHFDYMLNDTFKRRNGKI